MPVVQTTARDPTKFFATPKDCQTDLLTLHDWCDELHVTPENSNHLTVKNDRHKRIFENRTIIHFLKQNY